MKELPKGSVVFKHLPQDFIVEEIWGNEVCHISDTLESLKNHNTDIGKLTLVDRKPFLTCDLEKINLDHFKLLSLLAKELHNLPHELGYAGTKDKVAWTCQRISIFNADIDRIKSFSFPGIVLKNFKWAKHKIKIGDATGNRFRVVLRDVDEAALKILSRMRNTESFPNYFGPQRFGSLRKENVHIGTLIVKQKFEEAVFAYLTTFGDNESEEIKTAKKRLKAEKKPSEAKNYFPQELTAECRILDHLSRHEKDWIGALQTIGEKALLIMCQSVQSIIFNEVLEKALDENLRINNASIPLVGYNSRFSLGRLGEIEKEVVKAHNLERKDFFVPQIPFLSLKSSLRNACFKVNNLSIETEDDDIFKPSKKIVLTFTLDSGTYATTFLEAFFTLRSTTNTL